MLDLLVALHAVILGAVEGLTEFLPISSTGHLILVGEALGLHGPKAALTQIAIQGAAIFAICWEYRRKLLQTVVDLPTSPAARRFALGLVIAFLPLAILGLLFGQAIKDHLFNATVVGITLIVGGVIILWVDRGDGPVRIESVDDISPLDAAKLGLAQALALLPGTSRAAATIVGGRLLGLSRRCATEFSFFLAVPTLLVASAWSLYADRALLTIADVGPLLIAGAVAFLTALLTIRVFLRYVSSHSFAAFAWYRIVLGSLVLFWLRSV